MPHLINGAADWIRTSNQRPGIEHLQVNFTIKLLLLTIVKNRRTAGQYMTVCRLSLAVITAGCGAWIRTKDL